MEGLERAKMKNRVLQLLLERKGQWGIQTIYTELDEPTPTQRHFEDLIDEMIKDAGKFFDFEENDIWGFLLGASHHTEGFLSKGGFVSLYNQEQSVLQRQLLDQQEQVSDIANQRKKNKHQARLAEWQVWIFWPMFVLGAVGGGYSIYQIADRIFNPKEIVTKEEFEQFKMEMEKPIEIKKDTIK